MVSLNLLFVGVALVLLFLIEPATFLGMSELDLAGLVPSLKVDAAEVKSLFTASTLLD